MGRVAFRPGSFHGVAVFYSLIHLPRDEQPPLLARIAEWLRPGGMLVVTMGVSDMAAATDGFFGAAMFWSGYDAASNEQMVVDAGLDLVSARIHTVEEFGTPVRFLWVHAQKPCAS